MHTQPSVQVSVYIAVRGPNVWSRSLSDWHSAWRVQRGELWTGNDARRRLSVQVRVDECGSIQLFSNPEIHTQTDLPNLFPVCIPLPPSLNLSSLHIQVPSLSDSCFLSTATSFLFIQARRVGDPAILPLPQGHRDQAIDNQFCPQLNGTRLALSVHLFTHTHIVLYP